MIVSKICRQFSRDAGTRTDARRGPCIRVERLETRGLLSGGLIPTSLEFAESSVVYGQESLLSAFVDHTSGTLPPTGTVTFTIDGVPQRLIDVVYIRPSVGIAILSLGAAIAPGTHHYTASYSGDSDYAPSFASTENNVAPLPTAVQLTSTPPSSSSGQSVTFHATVSAVLPRTGIDIPVPAFTGTVLFEDGSTVLQRVPVDAAGDASFTTSTLSVGSHPITAVYGGNTDLAPSTSKPLVETVAPPDDGPIVTSFERFGYHMQPTKLVLTFSKALSAGPAQDVANYGIVRVGHRGRPVRRPIAVATATYNPTAQTVTLVPSHRLNVHWTYRLTVSGTAPNGLTDAAGVFLAGSGEGHPGTDYTTLVNRHSLAGSSVEKPTLARRSVIHGRSGVR